jgi:hypothetical protein
VITDRFINPTDDSYVSSLIRGNKGTDRILEKVEEISFEFFSRRENFFLRLHILGNGTERMTTYSQYE